MLFSRKIGAADSRYILAQKTTQPLPHVSPPHLSPVPSAPNSPHVTPTCATLPSLVPRIRGCEHKICFLDPLRIKKEKNCGFVSSRPQVFPTETDLVVFHHCVVHGLMILALALCASEPSLWSQPLYPQGEAPAVDPPPGPAALVKWSFLSTASFTIPTNHGVVISFLSSVKSLFFK